MISKWTTGCPMLSPFRAGTPAHGDYSLPLGPRAGLRLIAWRSRAARGHGRGEARVSCSLGLPERDLPAGRRADHAAPTRRALARLERDQGAEQASPVCGLEDLGDLDIR